MFVFLPFWERRKSLAWNWSPSSERRLSGVGRSQKFWVLLCPSLAVGTIHSVLSEIKRNNPPPPPPPWVAVGKMDVQMLKTPRSGRRWGFFPLQCNTVFKWSNRVRGKQCKTKLTLELSWVPSLPPSHWHLLHIYLISPSFTLLLQDTLLAVATAVNHFSTNTEGSLCRGWYHSAA